MKYAKGWIAGLMAVLTVVQPLVKDQMQTYDWFVVGAAILSTIGVVATPNRAKNGETVASRRAREY